MSSPNEEAAVLKEKGNQCVREGKYQEAILHYSHACTLEPTNASLFSNRSLAFLKIQQYYHAYEDALETIRIKPDWAKGFFRKGEVEALTFHFSDALISYKIALKLQPGDSVIEEAIKKTTNLLISHAKADEQVPWLGAGVGIILGVVVVLADEFLTSSPSLKHPLLRATLTIVVAVLGFCLAKAFRYFTRTQKMGLLQPPEDLLKEMFKNNSKQENGPKEKSGGSNIHHRYSRAQARFRLRKGKA